MIRARGDGWWVNDHDVEFDISRRRMRIDGFVAHFAPKGGRYHLKGTINGGASRFVRGDIVRFPAGHLRIDANLLP
jgi:hypothetical protein